MPIKEPNDDHNIKRVYPKMSEECSSLNNNVNLSDRLERAENITYLNNRGNTEDNKDDLNLPYDHIYASNTDNEEINRSPHNCQNTESEVRFLKEWLLMHLELIQQQNDEILNKEKTIYLLKQENEMLKERINCLDRGISFKGNNTFNNHEYPFEDTLEEMTQDAGHIDEDNKHNVYFVDTQNSGGGLNNSTSTDNLSSYEGIHCDKVITSDNCNVSPPQNTSVNCDKDLIVKQEVTSTSTLEENTNNEDFKSKNSPVNNSSLNLDGSSFVVNSSMEDTLQNLRMSIKRKRLCSSSSAISNTDISIDEARSSRKKKKRKGSIRDEKLLTCDEQYVTTAGETYLGITTESEAPVEVSRANNLEVPRWRVKVYTSCYSMEGTENLDDEVYNKRHMRLENDERRRKRWDVQRIREQRIVEKLKQRQERVGSSSKVDEHTEPELSLWPTLEDVKYLEVCDQLPVSAFGAPIPRFQPSEFILPWLNNTQAHASLKKNSNRKSTIRRKATKR